MDPQIDLVTTLVCETLALVGTAPGFTIFLTGFFLFT